MLSNRTDFKKVARSLALQSLHVYTRHSLRATTSNNAQQRHKKSISKWRRRKKKLKACIARFAPALNFVTIIFLGGLCSTAISLNPINETNESNHQYERRGARPVRPIDGNGFFSAVSEHENEAVFLHSTASFGRVLLLM